MWLWTPFQFGDQRAHCFCLQNLPALDGCRRRQGNRSALNCLVLAAQIVQDMRDDIAGRMTAKHGWQRTGQKCIGSKDLQLEAQLGENLRRVCEQRCIFGRQHKALTLGNCLAGYAAIAQIPL